MTFQQFVDIEKAACSDMLNTRGHNNLAEIELCRSSGLFVLFLIACRTTADMQDAAEQIGVGCHFPGFDERDKYIGVDFCLCHITMLVFSELNSAHFLLVSITFHDQGST